MIKSFTIMVAAFAFLALYGCAQLSDNTTSTEYVETTTTIDGVTYSRGSSVMMILPDVPVPIELKRDEKNTMLISTPTYKGGIFVFKGNVTSQSLVDFFNIEMPKYGWEPSGSISAKKKFLGFAKAPKSSALIQIEDKPFYTLVQIWVSEPTVINTVPINSSK